MTKIKMTKIKITKMTVTMTVSQHEMTDLK